MSVRIMSQVWELKLKSTDKLVLLAFADHANDDGRCYPSTDWVAHKSGLSRRHTVRVIKSMIDRGLIRVDDYRGDRPAGKRGGRGRRLLTICPENGDTMSPFVPRSADVNGDTMSPFDDGVMVTSDPINGDTMSPEPLEEPPGTSFTDSSLRSESAEPPRSITAQVLVGAWIDLQPERPSSQHVAKQAAVAKRICEQYGDDAIQTAISGMGKLYPHSAGEPWDLFDLERKFPKAVQAAVAAPKQTPIEAFLESLPDGGSP